MTNAFAVIGKNAGRQFHTDVMKLRMLNSKIRAELLVAINTDIYMQMNMQPMVMTYTSTLFNYRNTVKQRHPNANNPNKTRRRIQTLAGFVGRGRGGVRGSRRGRRGRKGRGSGNTNDYRNDE